MQIDAREFRRTVGTFATGVTVLTAQLGADIHGMTANSFTSISLDPLLILISIDRRARMCSLIETAGRFAVTVLGEGQEAFSRHFAGRPDPELAVRFELLDGLPVIAGGIAGLACSTNRLIDGGDHLIVLGRVDALLRREQGEPPLLYVGGRYRRLAPDVSPGQPEAELDFLHHNILSFT